jgi:Na+/proline symporter
MSIGTGIVLFVIGAVLAFAVNLQNSVVDLHLVGYILMAAGAVVFVIGLVFMLRKRQSITTVHSTVDPASGASIAERRTATTPTEPLS